MFSVAVFPTVHINIQKKLKVHSSPTAKLTFCSPVGQPTLTFFQHNCFIGYYCIVFILYFD